MATTETTTGTAPPHATWLTRRQAAERLLMSLGTFDRRHRDDDRFPQPRLVGKTQLWPPEELDRYVHDAPRRSRHPLWVDPTRRARVGKPRGPQRRTKAAS